MESPEALRDRLEKNIEDANQDVKAAVDRAIRLAESCLEDKVPYEFGGKGLKALDCSGLVETCYIPVLPSGVEYQLQHLKRWLFVEHDIKYMERGDLIFLATSEHPNQVVHIGIISGVKGRAASVIHASGTSGKVIKAEYKVGSDSFQDNYLVRAIGKMSLYLYRRSVDERLETKDAN